MLREHPSVYFPDVKEPNYLTYPGGSRSWYESLYEAAGGAVHRGDASPSYSMFPIFAGVPERAAALVPGARIIYMIRHPVRRMVSHWVQATAAGHEHRALEEALVWCSMYYASSCYGMQLARWAEAFHREAVLVLRTEDLQADPESVIERILRHLELDAGWRPANPALRANTVDGKFRTPHALVRASGALRGAGFDQAAWRLSRRSPFKHRAGLMRPFDESELRLQPELEAALLKCFRADFRLLRELLGDDVDLYGIA